MNSEQEEATPNALATLYVLSLVLVVVCIAVCTGCSGPPPTCTTTDGIEVYGQTQDCSAMESVVSDWKKEANALGMPTDRLQGLNVFIERGSKLNADGSITSGGIEVAGVTTCDYHSTTLAMDDNWTIRSSALAHELFHTSQGCIFDKEVYNACKQEGVEEDSGCIQDAYHPHWADAIQPAIRRVQEGQTP